MLENEYFLVDDIDALRGKVLGAPEGDQRNMFWNAITRSVRSSVYGFAWYAPFVAVITREPRDIENAKTMIRAYIDKLDLMNYCMGLQFHFWCFAFPHAKICIYFQWLCELGVYSEEEKEEISARLLNYQFTNFYYGMRTKPEPECVDNQTLSLALSNVIVGFLFTQGAKRSHIAEIMLRDGLKRIPEILGGFPKSGYTGEGSTYMDVVIGPSIWITVEVLERIWGKKDLLFAKFPPSMVRPIDMLKLIADSWMPGGLLLPWDNYGYQLGIRSALAYVAKKTGEPVYCDKLEHAVWSYDVGAGWAYDDLVWTLVHFPEKVNRGEYERGWFVPEVGGVICKNDRYVFQMWDESAPNYPTRMNCNPNSVVFNAFDVPLSADGAKSHDCRRFEFDTTWKTVNYLKMNENTSFNFGEGCVGGHSCILIDGNEAMMAVTDGEQTDVEHCAKDENSVTGDVTPVYKQNYPDIELVRRKTTLLGEKFFLVEDVVRADKVHTVTARFVLRPELAECETGVCIKVNQGVSLQLVPLSDRAAVRTEVVEGYPRKPENKGILADFIWPSGSETISRVLAFPSLYISPMDKIVGFKGIHTDADLTPEQAEKLLKGAENVFDLLLPPYMEKNVPVCRKWWFKKRTAVPKGATHLILPIGLINGKLFVNGKEINLSPFKTSANLLYSYVKLTDSAIGADEMDILFFTEVPVDHYENGGDGRTGIFGGMRFGAEMQTEKVLSAAYRDGKVFVETDRCAYEYAYESMEEKR